MWTGAQCFEMTRKSLNWSRDPNDGGEMKTVMVESNC